MKNLILIVAMFISMISVAQTQMNVTRNIAPEVSYFKYVGDASDTIKRVADSVYVEYIVGFDHEYKINVGSKFDLVTAADTTVVINIWGKNFADESYTLLNQTTSSNIAANNTTVSSAYTTAARYRYIKVSYKLGAAPKSAGVKIDQIEIKIWKP